MGPAQVMIEQTSRGGSPSRDCASVTLHPLGGTQNGADRADEISDEPRKGFRQTALAFDGRFVVIGYDNAFIGIEVATGQIRWSTPTTSLPGTFVRVAAMGFESKRPWFEAALSDGNVIRFNGLTGHEQRRFRALVRPPEPQRPGRPGKPDISSATFSGDGRIMAAASEEWVSLWDVQAGALWLKTPYARARGCLLALARDGKTLAIADVANAPDFGEDKIRLYDVATGELVRTIEPVDNRANVLAFSPDGAKLLTGFLAGFCRRVGCVPRAGNVEIAGMTCAFRPLSSFAPRKDFIN